jgi:hypothetical protein
LIAVLADTHMPKGSRCLPERCVELIAEADAVIHAGDFFGVSALEELESLCPILHAVYGNVDEPALQRSLPPTLEVELGGRSSDLSMTPDRLRVGWRVCAAASLRPPPSSSDTVTSPSTRKRAAFRSSTREARPSGGGRRARRWDCSLAKSVG